MSAKGRASPRGPLLVTVPERALPWASCCPRPLERPYGAGGVTPILQVKMLSRKKITQLADTNAGIRS